MAIVKVSKTVKMWMGEAKAKNQSMNKFWVDVLRESQKTGRQATFANSGNVRQKESE
jgi:hypothetical protein